MSSCAGSSAGDISRRPPQPLRRQRENSEYSPIQTFGNSARMVGTRAGQRNLTNAALTAGNAGFGKLASSHTRGRQLQVGLQLVW
jgi:hypothetical protein